MPISFVDGQILDGKGNPAEHTVTRIKIGLPGEEIVIEDEKGIEISKDPETGLPQVRADNIKISSEQKPINIFSRFFKGGKER